jgi:hypothetical protein
VSDQVNHGCIGASIFNLFTFSIKSSDLGF